MAQRCPPSIQAPGHQPQRGHGAENRASTGSKSRDPGPQQGGGGSGEGKAESEKTQKDRETEKECLRFREVKRGKGEGSPGQEKRKRVVRDREKKGRRGDKGGEGAERRARAEPGGRLTCQGPLAPVLFRGKGADPGPFFIWSLSLGMRVR